MFVTERTTGAGADLVNTHQQMTNAINTHNTPISELAPPTIIYGLLTSDWLGYFSDQLKTI